MEVITSLSALVFLSIILCIQTSADCGCNKLIRETKQSDFEGNGQCISKSTGSEQIQDENTISHMSLIPGGKYKIGTSEPIFPTDRESPETIVSIEDFYLDKYEVSNREFHKFVEATRYVTEAEKYNDSFIFGGLLSQSMRDAFKDFRVVQAPWWYKVNGVNWKHPHGPESGLEDLWDHPVVHVSWNDAVNYCQWRNKRLPTEAEWEVACRGGKKGKLFPWGNKLNPREQHWMNIWQGSFPDENSAEDGYETTCPVSKFLQNDFGLFNIVGNVWEWTSDLWDMKKTADPSENPNRVKKGGSYLCHKSYCYRYRCAARSQNTQDSSAGNLGFRCAQDI